MNLLITVFSDASIRGEQVGCGYWLKSSETMKTGSLTTLRADTNSNEAELWGIWHAIEAARKHHEGLIDIVLQCDNITALACLHHTGHRWARTSKLTAGPRRKMSPFEQSLVDKINNIQQIGKIWLKHVKGHSGGCNRTYVNNLTDKLAGQASSQKL